MTAETTGAADWTHHDPSCNADRYDSPWDHRSVTWVVRRTRETHRFPAAIYLGRDLATAERDAAQRALDAIDRSWARAVLPVGAVVAALFVAILGVLVVSPEPASREMQLLWGLGAALGVGVVSLFALIHRHDRRHTRVAARLATYEARLADLGPAPDDDAA